MVRKSLQNWNLIRAGCLFARSIARKITDSTIDNWITKTAELLDPLDEYLKWLVIGQRKELRLNESLPILNELGKTLVVMNKTVAPRSPMGLALEYMIKRWDILLNCLYDGSLEIDNNLVENAIRPNAIGRKNCLFAGSHNGARRSAIFYSFFGTCKKHNINLWQWLKKVLENIPDYPANKLADLLPQNMKL